MGVSVIISGLLVLLVAHAHGSSSVTSPCDPGWVPFGGNCYRFYNGTQSPNKLQWTTAYTHCQTQGGYLVSIDSQAENDFLSTHILASGLLNKWVAIGLREERQRSTFNVWRWYPSMKLPTFTQWAGGELMGENLYAYLVVGSDPRQSVWIARHNSAANFVCERGCGNAIADTLDPNIAVSGHTSYLGAMVTYTCPSSFFRLGHASRNCLGNSLWSYTEPQCIDSSSCPDGWVQYDSNCYHAFNSSVTWDDAQAICSTKGAYLANIANSAENLFLGKFLDTIQYQNIPVWFGLSEERVFSSNGDWRWRPRGQVLSAFTAWAVNEPHNLYPWDCAAIILDGAVPDELHWYDYRCDSQHAFICERGCHEPSVDGIQMTGNSSHVNGTVSYSCSSGYEIVGQTDLVCLVGGHWDTTSYPRCEPATGARSVCNDTHMQIAVGKFDVAGFSPTDLHLVDSSCTFQQNTSHYFTTTRLDGGCSTSRDIQEDQVAYSNRVLSNTGSVNISVKCYIKTVVNLTLAGALEERDPVTLTASPGVENYDIRFAAFNDSTYRFEYVRSAFPTPLFTTDALYMSAYVRTANSLVTGLRGRQCWATPGDQLAQPQVIFLNDGCPSVLGETNVYATSNKRSYNLSVAIGSRIATVFSAQLFYIHCSVRVCHLDDSASLCSKTCGSAGSPVQKRASGDEVADRTAHVFFGPFHLRSVDKNAERASGKTSTTTMWGSITAVGVLVALLATILGMVLYRRRRRINRHARYEQRKNSAGALLVVRNNLDSDSTWTDGLSDCDIERPLPSSDSISLATQMTFMAEDGACALSSQSVKDLEDVF